MRTVRLLAFLLVATSACSSAHGTDDDAASDPDGGLVIEPDTAFVDAANAPTVRACGACGAPWARSVARRPRCA